jgi:hypothetical protein
VDVVYKGWGDVGKKHETRYESTRQDTRARDTTEVRSRLQSMVREKGVMKLENLFACKEPRRRSRTHGLLNAIGPPSVRFRGVAVLAVIKILIRSTASDKEASKEL